MELKEFNEHHSRAFCDHFNKEKSKLFCAIAQTENGSLNYVFNTGISESQLATKLEEIVFAIRKKNLLIN